MDMLKFNRAILPWLCVPISVFQGNLNAATLPSTAPQAIISAASSWGSETDPWAGYTGSVKVWTPLQVEGAWTLTFISRDLGNQASGFWNGNASYDAVTGKWTITSPSWTSGVAANTALELGFNGKGVLKTSFTVTDCFFNGLPCVASVKSASDAAAVIAGLESPGTGSQGGFPATNPPVPTPQTPPVPTPQTPPVAAPQALEVLFSVASSWNGGYSGNLSVKNNSAATLPEGSAGWSLHLKFPDKLTAQQTFQSGPWNFAVAFGDEGSVTITPQSWSAALAPGATASSGFNGVQTSDLQKVTSLDTGVTLQFASSVPASGSSSGATAPAPSNPSGGTVPSAIALPTGNASGFVYSPYKDVTISMNWNTNVMTTVVGGAPLSLLTALPPKVPALTLAFATGTCGSENWGGVKADDFAKANVPLLVAQGKNYVVSTGGAAGAFNCSSAAGMRAFINRYASANLIGVDFDIEAGQSEQDIANLVKSVADIQGEFPGLRFSFTIATLGSSNGGALTSPYGDLNVIGYNTLKAISLYPIANYTINLMVMDYGTAGAQNCFVGASGKCDMGQTAIQAAKNLKDRFGVAYGRIELTPMIGVNDVSDEIFTLNDVDVMTQWVRANGLAGIHFWSLDRDTPCTTAGTVTASAICNSLQGVPAWSYTQRFVNDLGL